MRGNKIKDRTGEVSRNFQGLEMKIVSYRGARDLTIEFEDGTIVKKAAYKEFSNGAIKNVNVPFVYGVGYMGEGEYTARINTKMSKCYQTWCAMLQRCYCPITHAKHPTYSDCVLVDEWHNFQNFAKWFYKNYKPDTMHLWHLDKDIICGGCKIYSPDNCVFVPNEINVLFSGNNKSKKVLPIGVSAKDNKYQATLSTYNTQNYLGFYNTPEEAFVAFKTAKEKYMKEVGDKWKDLLDPRVYEALINYTVNITD